MSSVAFSGLSSGLDTGSIVSQLVELKRAPIYRLEDRKSQFKAQISALGTLKTKLLDFQNALKDLDSAREFSSLSATTSDEDYLTVSAGKDAAAGNYTFEIEALAKAQKSVSQGFDSADDSVGSGIMSFTVDGETVDINLMGYTSLEGLAGIINNDVAGVSATIINDGSASGNYSLVLSSEEAGSDNAFTVDVSGLSGGITPLFTTSTPASDATVWIDGHEVTMGSNSSDEVISGLTLNLLQAEVGKEITVSVSVDTEGISEKVKSFVDKYNDLFSYISDAGGAEGELNGNPTLRAVASRIENIAISALDTDSDISNFFQAGISRGEGRQLKWEEDEFLEALDGNFSGVRDLFIERDGNLGKMYLFDQAIENMTDSIDGLFKISTDALNKRIDYADQGIERYERSVESYQTTLERKFTAMEMMMSQLQAQGSYLAGLGN